MSTTYALKSHPAAARLRLVAARTDAGWRIQFHDTGKPFCAHVHTLEALAAHYKSAGAARAVCPKCAEEGCAHRFVAPLTKTGACFFCKVLHAAPEKKVKLTRKCAAMFVGQEWMNWKLSASDDHSIKKSGAPVFTFADYPPDIITEILSHLDSRSIGNFIQSEVTIWEKYKLNIPLRLMRLFNLFLAETFPLMNDKYVSTHAPILIRDNLLQRAGLEDSVPSEYQILRKRDFVNLLKSHTKEMLRAYVDLQSNAKIESRIAMHDALPALFYNCRDPKKLFGFMRGFRLFLNRPYVGDKSIKEHVIGKFNDVADLYGFDKNLLIATLNDVSLWPIDPATKVPFVESNPRNDYLRHYTGDYLPSSGSNAITKYPEYGPYVDNKVHFFKVEVYTAQHAVVISEALNFLTEKLVVNGNLLSTHLGPYGIIILDYISSRWDDDVRYYARLLILSLRMLFKWKVYFEQGISVKTFIKKLRGINEDWAVEYANEIEQKIH